MSRVGSIMFLGAILACSFAHFNEATASSGRHSVGGDIPRPPPGSIASTARWLVARAGWGVLSTTSEHLRGTAWGNIVSYSDGVGAVTNAANSTGRPYFYLSDLDPTGRDLARDPRATLTLSAIELGGSDAAYCAKLSAEDPTCLRVSLSGTVSLLKQGSPEFEEGLRALFDRHPAMKGWPDDHSWLVMRMEPTAVFAIDFYGGAKNITVSEYLSAKP